MLAMVMLNVTYRWQRLSGLILVFLKAELVFRGFTVDRVVEVHAVDALASVLAVEEHTSRDQHEKHHQDDGHHNASDLASIVASFLGLGFRSGHRRGGNHVTFR